jgi:hypothetical protein
MPRRGNRNAVVDGLSGVSDEDIAVIQRLGKMDAADLQTEMGLLRFYIRQMPGEAGDKVQALDAIGQATVRLSQILKAQRVLKGEAADSLAAAMAVALKAMGEELGIGDGQG